MVGQCTGSLAAKTRLSLVPSADSFEPARAGIQPIEANQAPFAADGVQRRCKRALRRQRRVRHTRAFYRRTSFHKVTGLPQSAFLLFSARRASLLAEAKMIIEMRTYK